MSPKIDIHTKILAVRRLDINFNDFAGTRPSRFGSIVAHTDLDGEVSGSSPGHTKDFENGAYFSSACAGQNELE